MTRSFIIVPASQMNTFWYDRTGIAHKPGDARKYFKKRERHLQRRQFRKITEAAMQDYYDEIEDRQVIEDEMWAQYSDDIEGMFEEEWRWEDEYLDDEPDDLDPYYDEYDYGDEAFDIGIKDEHYHIKNFFDPLPHIRAELMKEEKLTSLADILMKELTAIFNADLIDKNGV